MNPPKPNRAFQIAFLASMLGIGVVTATPEYSSGNIVLAHHSQVLGEAAVVEYTPAGTLVREVQIFPPPGTSEVNTRDLVVDPQGRIHVQLRTENGNYTLATLNLTGAWEYNPIDNWTLDGVTYFGAMGINGDYIYAPDNNAGDDPNEGIVRYPLADLSSPQHFPTQSFHAIKVGLNGLVYGIDRDGNAEWFHPESMQSLGRLPRGKLFHGDSVVSVAVDAEGNFYTVDLGDSVNRFDKDGNFIGSLDLGTALGDIEISNAGDLIIVGVNRKVFLTNTELDTPCEFPIFERSPASGRSFLNFALHTNVPKIETRVPTITELAVVDGDHFSISFQSQPDNRYSLQASSDLGSSWMTIQQGITGNGEIRQFIDTNAISSGRRYYRVFCEYVSPH